MIPQNLHNVFDFIEWYSKHNLIISVRDINYSTDTIDVLKTNETKNRMDF